MTRPEAPMVPRALEVTAAWAWRALVIGAAAWVAVRAVVELRLVILPVVLALVLTTMLAPPARRLHAAGMPATLAAILCVAALVGSLGLVGWLLAPPVAGQGDELVGDIGAGAGEVLDGVGVSEEAVRSAIDAAVERARDDAATIASGIVSGTLLAIEIVAGALLALVLTFFFVKDGERMWAWALGLLPAGPRAAADDVAPRLWRKLAAYLRGLVIVALFDAVLIGLALVVLGVPLALPLAVATFFGAFVPIVGATVTGLAAVLVALVDGGVRVAMLVAAAVLVVQQVESQVLQPVVMGRALALHPVAVLLAVTAGGVTFGLVGAALAPMVAALATTAAAAIAERGRDGAPPGSAGPWRGAVGSTELRSRPGHADR